MKLKKKQAEIAEQLIDWWEEEGLLAEGQPTLLKDSLERRSINWRKVARYLMGLAVVSIVVAFLQLVADKWIMELLERLFEISDFAVFGLLIVLSLLFYGAAARLKTTAKGYALTKSTLLLLGGIAFGGALHYLGKFSGANEFLEVGLVLVFALQAFVVGRLFLSDLFYDLGWIALFLWLGLETSRQTQWEGTWLGMNLPLRFFLFSLLPVVVGLTQTKRTGFKSLALSAQLAGWVFFCSSLWLLALFGNHTSLETFEEASAVSLLPWGVFMALVAAGFLIFGRIKINRLFLWMGVGGLLAVSYSQYFLFLWEPLHPALFFAIMGISFWLLGRKAETLRGS